MTELLFRRITEAGLESRRGLKGKEQDMATFYKQIVEQEMSLDGSEVRDSNGSNSDFSPNRKRSIDPSDNDVMYLNEDGLENEASEAEAKRRKTDGTGNRKPNTDQWDAMFLRLAAYKAEKGVS